MPKLWTNTIESHRREVRGAILETTAALAVEHGLLSVTMSHIAEEAGIGRATLYKYFPDVESILQAWHQREIARHLDDLAAARDRAGADPIERLRAVLVAYAELRFGRHHEPAFGALLHRGGHVAAAERRLHEMLRELLLAGVETGGIRGDVSLGELVAFCTSALGAATGLSSRSAVRRLVELTVAGMASHP